MLLGTSAALLAVILSPLLFLAFPVVFPLLFFRWLYLLLTYCSGSPSNLTKLLLFCVEDLLFYMSEIPSGIRLLFRYSSVENKVYTRFKKTSLKADIYRVDDPTRPTIIFIYGGAWGSGGRWMYCLLAQRLSKDLDVNVVVPDYSYYPEASMTEMAYQIQSVDKFAHNLFDESTDIWWMGHSAGAHLVMLYHLRLFLGGSVDTVIETNPVRPSDFVFQEPPTLIPSFQSLPDLSGRGVPLPQSVRFDKINKTNGDRTRGLFLLSGVYDIRQHLEYETARGVHQVSPMKNATFGHFESSSPTSLLDRLIREKGGFCTAQLLQEFPTVHFMHGSRDLSVPDGQSHVLQKILSSVSVKTTINYKLPFGHASIITHLSDRKASSALLSEIDKIMKSHKERGLRN
eukprot:TRINITY_DN3989_c1_g1_i1.p1 TRINITY_DN3989_c1_g1~~TRINITY_DN3989_c1_g1_i1.p1  ORF type:complete len:400 (+),score=43.58 TRINITY_DN3989_c1_g1_i1:67-1266(+)